MLSNLVCNHTHDKQIGLPLCGRLILLSSYDYRPNWTPLSPITITYYISQLVRTLWLVNLGGHTLLYSPLNSKVCFSRCLWTQRYNKYLTNLVFSVRTWSYGSSFFSTWIYGLRASRLGHKSEQKKLGP